jgi:glycosyltransferase involved in cell wall biosynthesis
MTSDDDYDLSVVIISRNEERNIAKCIESVLKAAEEFDASEIVLVDSASTDRTVEIAAEYPIRILQLDSSSPFSPAAGFYTGFLNTKGKYIQFQCGDTVLDENWFRNALPILEKDERVAGVAGIVTQEPYDTRTAKRYVDYHKNLSVGEVTWFAGDTLFKRDVLLEVGTFNPHLLAGEEGELCYRVLDKGYKLLRLPHHMSHHLGCDKEPYLSYIKKTFRYAMAQGQILRYSLNSKQIFQWRLGEYKFKLLSAFLGILGVLSVGMFFASGNGLLIYIWAGGIFFYFGWVLYEIRDLKNAVYRMISQALKCIPFMLGFLKAKKDIGTYPVNVKIIRYQ